MTNEERVRRYWDAFWSGGDASAATDFYARTFRLNGRETSREEWLDEALAWRSSFRDFAAQVDFAFECGDAVVSRVTYTGTFDRESYRGLSPRGRRIDISGLDVFQFEGESVADHWHEADHHTMFVQLGAALRPSEDSTK